MAYNAQLELGEIAGLRQKQTRMFVLRTIGFVWSLVLG
jgi:hypothetical protein